MSATNDRYGWSLEFDDFTDEEDETMVDLGGGMVVPLRELMEDDDES